MVKQSNMQKRPVALNVFYDDRLVGTLHDTSPLAFDYAAAWLEWPQGMPLAAIPMQPGLQDAPSVQAFFENLLPEAELRQYLSEQRKATTLFSLLWEVAGDTAGAFVIVSAGQQPAPPAYVPTTWQAIAARMKQATVAMIDVTDAGARISLAGAQDKNSVAIFDGGVPQLPLGTAPSTHIIKPDIKRLAKVWHSAANETLVMTIAAKCGLPTAEVFYEPHTQSCVVRRFDRVTLPGPSLRRLVQYDLCQLAGVLSERKYEKEGGPGLAECARLIREYSHRPIADLRHFVLWIFFNLYAGNNDSHAKNLSMYRLPGKGLTLAPFYDLMCTREYPDLSREFAFSIGGEVQPGRVGRAHLRQMAIDLRMSERYVLDLARELATIMPKAVDEAMAIVMPTLPSGAKDLTTRVSQFVLSTTRKCVARFEQD